VAATKVARTIDVSKPWKGEHEHHVHSVLLRGAETLLKAYPTSLEEDLQWLGVVRSSGSSSGGSSSGGRESTDGVSDAVDDTWTVLQPKIKQSMSERQRQAVLMRIETKRILHSTVLESLHGMRKAHNMSHGYRSAQLLDETVLPLDSDDKTKDMEVKRNAIHVKMKEHFLRESREWDKKWRSWRRSVHLVWGGGGLPDPMEREAREHQVNQIIAENAKMIAEEIKKEAIDQVEKGSDIEETQHHQEEEQQRLAEQQKKDLETFLERGERASVDL
jgi:hypothetical protein